MSHNNLVSSRRSKAKSSALDHPLHDPQPLHTSRSPLQAPKTGLADAQIAQDGEAKFRAPPPSFTSMPPSSSLRGRLARWVPRWRSPSPNRDRPTTYGPEQSIADTSLQLSPDNLRPSLSLENVNNTPSRRDPHAIHEKSAVSPGRPGDTSGVGYSSSIESLPAPVASAEATDSYEDRKKTIMGAIKLLLQTSSTVLKFAPIPNLDQIPTTLLTWIQAYESVASNVEDMEKLYVVIQQVRDSVLQPLREWTGEIPPN
ncbi:uncharacterized protein EI90DRAFT_2202999 [Cantharellus anzutake]|uniref:uncharacterized protein n=1 Tax=Cantharellus anzutake TaxID=1750568 RepID=UPI001907A0F2|nr:uncharacterized protein EI90DRAFT_2202999 [Cantharellus anzutake]KAF8324970.1 hypothetical protein EI90DRAFT_2202999 [Cantharellus anzutake]